MSSAGPPPPTLPDPNSGPRAYITSPDDHAGIALVICTLLAVWSLLCFMIRIYMRMTVSGPFGIDDYLCGVATFFGMIQMIISCIAVSYGFARSTALLTAQQIVSAEKAIYAAELFFIITVTLTKCTVALLLARIVFIKQKVRACYAVLIISVLWGFASFIAIAVPCTYAKPWTIVGNNQCNDRLTAWEAIIAFDVIIELLIFALPIWLVWNLQTKTWRKFTVVAVFSLRLPVIIAAIVRAHYLSRAIGSAQPLLYGLIPYICLNVEMHYGLMSATWPTLKPFVGAFNTGWGTYDTQGISGYGFSANGTYPMRSLERNKNASQNSTGAAAGAGARGPTDRAPPRAAAGGAAGYVGKNVTHVRSLRPGQMSAASQPGPMSPQASARRDSTGSNSSKRHMIIRQTMTCEVHYEDQDPMSTRPTTHSSRGEGDSIEYARRIV